MAEQRNSKSQFPTEKAANPASKFNSRAPKESNNPPVSNSKKIFQTTIPLSSSVDIACNNLNNNTAYPALVFAYEILKNHSDYVPSLYSKGFGELKSNWENKIKTATKNRQRSQKKLFTASGWLEQITGMLNTNIVHELHGRIVILGLSILDDELNNILSKDSYLVKLSEEVKEKMQDVFIPEAYQLFRKKVLKEGDQTDKVPNKTDNPLSSKEQDKLDRYAFAEFIVKLLNNTNEKYGSYTLHLYAPWGAGKTSTLNFMKKIMKQGVGNDISPAWHIIDFNAWQNQHLDYPWWTMMDSVYKQVWKKLIKRPLKFINEFYWRLNSQTLNYFFAVCILTWITFFLIVPVIKNSDNIVNDMSGLFEKLGKTAGGILAIWAFVLGIGRYVSGAHAKSAETYLASRKDPMNSFHKRFKNIIEAVKPGRIAIYIDDLDRCKSSYVISLLESLQTLFNYQHVFFIIAADKKWINACYEVEYNPIKSYITSNGKPIGTLFIEKMFQQSIALPGVHNEMKQKLWESLLVDNNENQVSADQSIVTEMQNASTIKETEDILARAKNASFQTDHAVRLAALKKMAEEQTITQTEHLLKPYNILLDMNPRNMKRLLNSYSAIKASAIISHIDISIHQTILWAILTMRWPLVAEYILEHADVSSENIKLNAANIPVAIAPLFQEEELKTLLNGGAFSKDGPLEAKTILQCRQLFI